MLSRHVGIAPPDVAAANALHVALYKLTRQPVIANLKAQQLLLHSLATGLQVRHGIDEQQLNVAHHLLPSDAVKVIGGGLVGTGGRPLAMAPRL